MKLISMVMVVTGSVALVELHDRQGTPVDDAIESSLWALGALIAASGGRRPQVEEEDTT